MIATVLESLGGGARTTTELAQYVDLAWPGAGVDQPRLETSLRAAKASGLVDSDPGQLLESWTLTETGRAEWAASSGWAADALDNFQGQLLIAAREAGFEKGRAEIELWAGILIQALCIGISSAFAIAPTAKSPSAQLLLPTAYNSGAMLDIIEKSVARSEVETFLKGQLVAALDESDPFAKDVITNIATGYTLHAFLGRRDLQDHHTRLGSLAGERAILDTPLVLALLGVERRATSIEQAIVVAIEAGMEIVLPDHVAEEVESVLDRVERDLVPDVEETIRKGVDIDAVRRTVDDDVIDLWLQCQQGGRCADWRSFRQLSTTTAQRLGDKGVVRRQHFNEKAFDQKRVEQCEAALDAEIAARAGGRGKIQIQRDANSMAMAWRAREKRDRASRVWPGAFLITPDTHLNAAYRAVNPDDPFPLCLSGSQWMGLLSTCLTPATSDELAIGAAAITAQQTMMSIATRFPPQIALLIASSISMGGRASASDVRLAQLDELIASQPDIVADPDAAGARIVSRVTAQRAQRVRMAMDVQRERVDAREQRDLELREALKKRAEHAELQLKHERRQVVELGQQLAQITAERSAQPTVNRVRDVSARLIIVVGTVFATVAGVNHWLWVAGATLLAILVFARQSSKWVKTPEESWFNLLVALFPEVFGLFEKVKHFG